MTGCFSHLTKIRRPTAIRLDDKGYIQTGRPGEALDKRPLFRDDETSPRCFYDRATGFVVYRRALAILLLGTVLMHLLSWLTRLIRLPTRATKRMAAGDYDYRRAPGFRKRRRAGAADGTQTVWPTRWKIISSSWKKRSGEGFPWALAHESLRRLTAIIGYADMLRSHRLDEEKQRVSCAPPHLHTKGRRLETMSLRLLGHHCDETPGDRASMAKVSWNRCFLPV